MDSKMECMRALIDKDPQSEGLFTGYSSSLERVALRKSRYLAGSESVPASSPPPAPNGHSAQPKPAPATGSLFGDKLLHALNDERN
jgi:hypothetical protein